MRATVVPSGRVEGSARVPGDKSIAHRWLILAATARGRSALSNLPPALDVRSTAACLSRTALPARDALDGWAARPPAGEQPNGSTWDRHEPRPVSTTLEIRAAGRDGLEVPDGVLDCGNSGTTMRLLAGVLASAPFTAVLDGDESLRRRPMERVAEPLRAMGAVISTVDGHAPIRIAGAHLQGIEYRTPVPSAQVKSAVLLAGLAADGRTSVLEPAPTRDHTERALFHLGAPITIEGLEVSVSRYQHEGFSAIVPGDLSSAAFLAAAAALTGGRLLVRGVGLNPSRMRFLDVMRRMGIMVEHRAERSELGEPVGELHVVPGGGLSGVTVPAEDLPLVIDEVPVLAALAVHARGDTWFLGAGELRVKESDRLGGLEHTIRALGGHAAVERDDLVIGGGGLAGGTADAGGDHRMAMAAVVAGLAARSDVVVDGIEAADVSFPGFVPTLTALGARIEG